MEKTDHDRIVDLEFKVMILQSQMDTLLKLSGLNMPNYLKCTCTTMISVKTINGKNVCGVCNREI